MNPSESCAIPCQSGVGTIPTGRFEADSSKEQGLAGGSVNRRGGSGALDDDGRESIVLVLAHRLRGELAELELRAGPAERLADELLRLAATLREVRPALAPTPPVRGTRRADVPARRPGQPPASWVAVERRAGAPRERTAP